MSLAAADTIAYKSGKDPVEVDLSGYGSTRSRHRMGNDIEVLVELVSERGLAKPNPPTTDDFEW